MGCRAAVRSYTGLLAWHGAPEFLGPGDAGSNYELGHSLEMPVVVGGAEDVLEGVYICRGANRDVYRCVLRAWRDLGGFVLKVGTTRYGQNASLSELLLLELGFRRGYSRLLLCGIAAGAHDGSAHGVPRHDSRRACCHGGEGLFAELHEQVAWR